MRGKKDKALKDKPVEVVEEKAAASSTPFKKRKAIESVEKANDDADNDKKVNDNAKEALKSPPKEAAAVKQEGNDGDEEDEEEKFDALGRRNSKKPVMIIRAQFRALAGSPETGGTFRCIHCEKQTYKWNKWNASKAREHLTQCEKCPTHIASKVAETSLHFKKYKRSSKINATTTAALLKNNLQAHATPPFWDTKSGGGTVVPPPRHYYAPPPPRTMDFKQLMDQTSARYNMLQADQKMLFKKIIELYGTLDAEQRQSFKELLLTMSMINGGGAVGGDGDGDGTTEGGGADGEEATETLDAAVGGAAATAAATSALQKKHEETDKTFKDAFGYLDLMSSEECRVLAAMVRMW